MAEEADVLDSWEELDDNEVLDKKLESIKIEQKKESSKPVTILQEEGSRTQYTPQVRILKRETNSGRGDNKTTKVQTPQKTLEQREAEYKEARLRILGENYSTEENTNNTNNSAAPPPETKEAEHKEARLRILGENYSTEENTNNTNNSAAPPPETKPVRLVKSIEDLKQSNNTEKVKILREPKGPDGSAGFQNR